MDRSPRLPRRTLLAGTAAFVAFPALLAPVRAQTRLQPTPGQTEGPFYPVELPADTDFDLLAQGDRRYREGQPTWLDGRVVDTLGRPVSGAVVEIWQCDHQGRYHHPGDGGRADPAFQGYGRAAVGADGTYRFRTIRPVPYTGRTPHIHVKVRLSSRELLTTQLYVEGEPGNRRDGLWRGLDATARAAVTVPFRAVAGGLQASFPIVVEA
ncbi:protocatechuate 3,4-dioxygenase [Schlegelella sp. S2-27]|uniref:Protocatechuate 3,4-dioxygenase n=1 Tax=Caldimonas mangrovi TaxID=2944811 RepID=A0ABT0YHH1_9BURK|nr:protocatechuate 3,4-dioxygenase [Caldimonas mangrovi]MCM5678186.1 protocatechuate 3,4-dioxygenase [Caldimonas mangrovi]